MLGFAVGQQVVYPSHGIAVVESVEEKNIGSNSMSFYTLRLADANSVVMVPVANATAIGLRAPISLSDCESLFRYLEDDFTAPASDWKDRFKDYSERMKSGDVFTIALVLKHLTFLSQVKPLSFREQRMLEKAEYLVVSELAAVCHHPECNVRERVRAALAIACDKHRAEVEPGACKASAGY